MIGNALLVSLAFWLIVVLARRLSVRRSTPSGRGRDLAAALAFILLLGMVTAIPTEAHESHRPTIPSLAAEGTASATDNRLELHHGTFDRSQESLQVRRAVHALTENYGYDERVRPVVDCSVDRSLIQISLGKRLESGVPRSAKSSSPKYDAPVLLRGSPFRMATKPGAGLAAEADHVVLGKSAGLDATASKVGGRTLMNDANWQQSVMDAINTPGTKITVSLDGVPGASIRSQVMSAAQRGASGAGAPFDWEISQLYQSGRLSSVTFVQGGKVVANPFG